MIFNNFLNYELFWTLIIRSVWMDESSSFSDFFRNIKWNKVDKSFQNKLFISCRWDGHDSLRWCSQLLRNLLMRSEGYNQGRTSRILVRGGGGFARPQSCEPLRNLPPSPAPTAPRQRTAESTAVPVSGKKKITEKKLQSFEWGRGGWVPLEM